MDDRNPICRPPEAKLHPDKKMGLTPETYIATSAKEMTRHSGNRHLTEMIIVQLCGREFRQIILCFQSGTAESHTWEDTVADTRVVVGAVVGGHNLDPTAGGGNRAVENLISTTGTTPKRQGG